VTTEVPVVLHVGVVALSTTRLLPVVDGDHGAVDVEVPVGLDLVEAAVALGLSEDGLELVVGGSDVADEAGAVGVDVAGVDLGGVLIVHTIIIYRIGGNSNIPITLGLGLLVAGTRNSLTP